MRVLLDFCLLAFILQASAFSGITTARSPRASSCFGTCSSVSHRIRNQSASRRHPQERLSMYICIDCAYVTNCAAYHFVESKHEQPHMTENLTFTPREGSPTIHVNIRTVRTEEGQKEIDRMWREHESETAKAEAASGGGQEGPLYGETVYNLSP